MSLHILCLEWAYEDRTTNNVHEPQISLRVLILFTGVLHPKRKILLKRSFCQRFLKKRSKKNEGRVDWGK